MRRCDPHDLNFRTGSTGGLDKRNVKPTTVEVRAKPPAHPIRRKCAEAVDGCNTWKPGEHRLRIDAEGFDTGEAIGINAFRWPIPVGIAGSEQNRLQSGAARGDGCRAAGRTGADDRNVEAGHAGA
jgi:hypothetical protein